MEGHADIARENPFKRISSKAEIFSEVLFSGRKHLQNFEGAFFRRKAPPKRFFSVSAMPIIRETLETCEVSLSCDLLHAHKYKTEFY